MRQTRAGPCSWAVLEKQLLGPPWNVVNDRGVDIAIAQFSASHFVDLALFHVGHCGEPTASCIALRALLINVLATQASPAAVPKRGMAGRTDISFTDLPAFGLVGLKELRPAPALQSCGQFPGQVESVRDAGIHAKASRRNDKVHSVAREEDAALAVLLGEQQVLSPLAAIDHFEVDRGADHGLELSAHLVI